MHHITLTVAVSNMGIPHGNRPARSHGDMAMTDAIVNRVSCWWRELDDNPLLTAR